MKKLIALAFSLLVSVLVFAEETPIQNLHSYKLKNGLELYVAENHTVPLAYIEICVRGGAMAQSAENAGVFHLYEHMMFKGNKKYKTAEEMQAAIKELGVAEWNGSTSAEFVNYFFTVPADKLAQGLEFWNDAIRFPKMDKREFEAEKDVVLSELDGIYANPAYAAEDLVSEKMFPEATWCRSAIGYKDVVSAATIKQLKTIQKEYYIPNNAALFVGGDVNPDEVYALVEKIWGSWKKGKNPWEKNNRQYTQTPLNQTEFYVLPFDQISPQMAQIQIIMRGPDGEFNRDDTYAPDLLFTFAEDPASTFKQSLVSNPNLGIPDPNYVSIGYLTFGREGLITSNAIVLSPEIYLPERTKLFVDEVKGLVNTLLPDESQQSQLARQIAIQRFHNRRCYEMETPETLLSGLRFWWVSTGADYYYDYIEKLSATTADQMEAFLNKYIVNANQLVIVYVNPDVYEACKVEYEENGFIKIGK